MIWLVVVGIYGFGLIASIGFLAEVADPQPLWMYLFWPITWVIGMVVAFGDGARLLANWAARRP